MYDSLAAVGRQREYEKELGRVNACGLCALILAAVSGGLLAGRHGYELNYCLSVGSMLVSLAMSLSLKEPDVKSRPVALPRVSDYVVRSVRFLRNNHPVRVVVLTGVILGASVTYIDEFWQVYLNRLGVPVPYFGVFSAALMLGRLPGNVLAHRLPRKLAYAQVLTAMIALFSAGFACLSLWPSGGMVAMILVSGCMGLVEPLVSGYLHHRIGSEIRATMDSFQSLGLKGANAIVGLGFGYLTSMTSITGGYGFIAAVCGAYLLWFVVVRKRLKL